MTYLYGAGSDESSNYKSPKPKINLHKKSMTSETKKKIKRCSIAVGAIAAYFGLLFGIDYAVGSVNTREWNIKRQTEYNQLYDKIFSGENPLADSDHNGKLSIMEETLAKEEMRVIYSNQTITLEAMRDYVGLRKNLDTEN